MRRTILTAAAAALSGCALFEFPPPPAAEPEPLQGARTVTYDCPRHGEVTARIAPDVAALAVDGVWRVLPRVRAASGAKFAADGRLLWDRGAKALISPDGGEPEECTRR